MRSVVLCLGALAVALLGAGCGDSGASGEAGDNSETTAAVQVAKPVFLKKAEVVCKKNYSRVRAKYQTFVADNGGPDAAFGSEEPIGEYADTVLIPLKRKMVEELQALGVPSGDEKEVGAIIAAYEEGIEVAEEDPSMAVTSTQGVFAYATAQAEKYGLKSCL